jgi:hypothetical protein
MRGPFALRGERYGDRAGRRSHDAFVLAPSRCGAGMEALATFLWRPRTGPVALRGGRHGAATAPPARGPDTRCANGVGSAMASPPRSIFMLCVHSFERDHYACEHPQRARDPWPEASTSAKAGSCGFEYSRVPPGRAVVVEAERSRVERGRPRDRGPARSGGCGRTSNNPARLLAPSPCGAGGMAPPLPLRRGSQARGAPVASVRQWPHRRVWGQAHA